MSQMHFAGGTPAHQPGGLDVVTDRDLARQLGIKLPELNKLVSEGTFPKPFTLGRARLWNGQTIRSVLVALQTGAEQQAAQQASATARGGAEPGEPPTAVPTAGDAAAELPHPGVSIYKPKARNKEKHAWILSYANPPLTKPHRSKTESVRGDKQLAIARGAEISRRLKMVVAGTLKPKDVSLKQPYAHGLTSLLCQFKEWFTNRGKTAKRGAEVYSRANKVVEWCGFQQPSDLNAPDVQAAVARYRERQCKLGMGSHKTCNDYLKSIRSFGRWLCLKGLLAKNPLLQLDLLNEEIDRRRIRRALTPDEGSRLLEAAAAGKKFQRMTGADRVKLYELAIYTGLRKSELASLTRGSFELDPAEGRQPVVRVQAGYTKNRKLARLAVPRHLVDALRTWLATRPADGPVFALPERVHVMLYDDLAAAGIPRQTPEGVVDFHALRHTHITVCGRNPLVSARTLQAQARHSDPRLTARYTHPDVNDMDGAVEAMPVMKATAARAALPPATSAPEQ